MSWYAAKVVSIRLTDKDRATIDAALALTERPSRYRYGATLTGRESRSEFIVKAALDRAAALLEVRNTQLEARPPRRRKP